MPLTRRRVTSADDMKALAHPLRMELLEMLTVEGPLTASEAGRRLGQNASNISWHLRTLAKHGFVRQASEGSGRSRPWKVVAESLSWGDDAEDEDAARGLGDVAVEREFQLFRAAMANQPHETPEWRDATTVNQSRLWLTPEEATELGEQMRILYLGKIAERHDDPTQRPPGARLMALMGWVVPARADVGEGGWS
ncbi:MAG: winged helix-turn-helix domain-containing protein [Nocardioidaceae bacterium]